VVDQKIEPPTEADVDAIARALIHAEHVVHEGLGRKLDGSRDDLRLLQELLDSSTVEREATYTLQALGLAFGRVFLTENPDYDWWMVEDEYGGVSRARRRARAIQLSLVFCAARAMPDASLAYIVSCASASPFPSGSAIGRSAAPRRNRQMRQANSIARKSLSGPRLLGIRQFLRVHGVITYAREEGIDCSHAIHVG
jgi:hypothetical protein